MRKIRIFAHISLDGVIEPGGPNEKSDFANGAWSVPFRTAAGAAALAEAQGGAFDLLLGRRTYDLWAAFWPTVKTGPFADALNAATKYVATHRPESLAWGPVEHLALTQTPSPKIGIDFTRAEKSVHRFSSIVSKTG